MKGSLTSEGPTRMPALEPGQRVEDFQIATLDGDTFALADALAKGPLVLAFFKITCPTCQYAFPFFDRVYRAYAAKVPWLGVSQDEARYTRDFLREFSVSFPVLLDDTDRYPVSNLFDIANVPSVFLVGADHKVQYSSIGWDKKELEALNTRLAKLAGVPPAPIFSPGERVEAWKAG
jgi:peroxiredoxin